MSDSASSQQDSAKRPVGRPFQKGDDPRRGKGFPALTPAQREAQALKECVAGRVVIDLAAEMKTHAAVAVEALRTVIEKGKHADQINAARVVLAYSHGMPVQSVDARMAFVDQATHITADDIKRAALRIAAVQAEDV